ncbi:MULTISPECIES: N-acetylmuramoyl-L-alanine amidase [unclassified Microcoleus]|uniref:N-acetylmuramoyl-L-alanine amidase n=1 Tax=unclassified Microcoleus TaxID=2642155 RepID=UPI002FD411F8
MPFTAKIVTAEAWGARPPKSGTFPFHRTIPPYIIVHHTDNPNPPNDASKGTLEGAIQLARNIQNFHMDKRGWSDSGHNFLNTTGGLILEGRHGSVEAVKKGFCIQSAHAAQDPGKLANGNQSPGIENEGNFMTFPMSPKQWESLVELCVSLCDSCKISPLNIKGHRDFSNTDCPGDWLYGQLPRLRKQVADKLGMRFTPEQLENESQFVALSFGSTGPAVIKIQQRLRDLGFNPGAVDGLFGENTEAAVKAFQRSVGLEDDGRVGINTRTKLGLS